MRVVCPHCGSVNNIPLRDSYKKASCGECKNSLLDTTPKELNEAEFDNLVVNSEILTVVDFWAPWCGPCKMMAPAFKAAAEDFPLKATFAKVNTEDHQVLSARFNIRSIPTIIAFKDNKEVDRVSGALSKEQLNQWVSSLV